jgi:hypothetical protein
MILINIYMIFISNLLFFRVSFSNTNEYTLYILTFTFYVISDLDREEKFEGWCVSEGVFISVLIVWIALQIVLCIAAWTAALAYVRANPVSSVKLRNVKWDDQAFN